MTTDTTKTRQSIKGRNDIEVLGEWASVVEHFSGSLNTASILLCDILDEQRKLNDHMRALADNMALSMTPMMMVDSAGRGPGEI